MHTQLTITSLAPHEVSMMVVKRSGQTVPFDINKIRTTLKRAGMTDAYVGARISPVSLSGDDVEKELLRVIFENISTKELEQAIILAATSFIEKDPIYNEVATRLLWQKLYREVIGKRITSESLEQEYRNAFIIQLHKGVKAGYLDKRLLELDLEKLANAMVIDRDNLFGYQGAHTLYSRYFMKIDGVQQEMPQTFWMRIAMGLSLLEENREEQAIKFYEVLSTLRYTPSTPTLFHAGMVHAQLSSCYLTTIDDDLSQIFKCMGDNAQLAKWAGGIGNDWTPIRATGAWIKSIHATSQGVIPYLKIANDIVVAITRSGIRRGGTCAYLESWHFDIDDFLDLKRNTGDERRRTHDMNTSNWIPDLFMKRVLSDAEWTLFSPHEVPDLHDIYGKKFEERYAQYEQDARDGKIKIFKTVSAKTLWRKMISRLFETGHPWITFKDPCNIRSPQDHAGVVHSSNLCTEITLNTSAGETAVCNLGSVNLANHVKNGALDEKLLSDTITQAIRMLDSVIDLNFYPTKEAKDSNQRHRPIGLGIMGFQDLLFKLDIPFSSPKALELADYSQEVISYNAIYASSLLAKEKGAYQSYKGSKWERGIFPVDTIDMLEKERGVPIDCSRTCKLDWKPVRDHVKKYGMRNSNTMAIAPTATISTIVGCYPSMEPIYKNIYVKANVSGEFTVANTYLVDDLKKLGLWTEEMLDKLKYFDGAIDSIEEIPQSLKEKYKTAFDLDPIWLIKITAARGKWIDQSQSHNVFMQGVSGSKLNEIYTTAWLAGLKTTYYLRSLGASQIEKSTLDAKKFGYTQKREYAAAPTPEKGPIELPQACSIENPDCESCQ